MRLIPMLALAAGLLIGGVALAEEAIPTAAGAPEHGAPLVASGVKPLTIDDSRNLYDDDGPRPVNQCGVPVHEDGTPDRRVHGAVWGGVGTQGYRDIGGAACIPLGDKGAAAIAIDVGRYGWRR